MRPVTTACALMVFQFWNCGATSILLMRSMKAAWSIGANRPERFRLLVMTCVTPLPTSASAARAWQEIGDRDRDRLEFGRIDADARLALGESVSASEHRHRRAGDGHEAAAGDRASVIHRKILLFGCHNISFRPKVIGMSFQLSYCGFGMNE
ncbi:hypothetical protein ACVWYI_001587 [Bradyrhizobium sp. LB13.1]